MTFGEHEARPSPILDTRSLATPVMTERQGASLVCVRAIVATGDAKIILQSDNEPAILDLQRQVAAECHVKRGMTVIIDDTTEYDSQSNGLAELVVREVKGVAPSIRVALGELYKKDISSKHPVLP